MVALAAGALAFLLGFPQRRRVVAVALSALLASAAFEGAVHAALHLHHLSHGAGLGIGASSTPPSVAGVEADRDAATRLPLLGEAHEWHDAPAADVVLASNPGRAPPLLAL